MKSMIAKWIFLVLVGFVSLSVVMFSILGMMVLLVFSYSRFLVWAIDAVPQLTDSGQGIIAIGVCMIPLVYIIIVSYLWSEGVDNLQDKLGLPKLGFLKNLKKEK